MSLAIYWRNRARYMTVVETKCVICGCVHPRSQATLDKLTPNGNRYRLPCVRCTEDISRLADACYTQQVIVVHAIFQRVFQVCLIASWDKPSHAKKRETVRRYVFERLKATAPHRMQHPITCDECTRRIEHEG